MPKVALPTMAQKVGIGHRKVKKNPTQFKAHFGWKSLVDHNYIKPVFFIYGGRY